MYKMNFCTKCGKKIENTNNRYCTNCGNPLFSVDFKIRGVNEYDKVESEEEAASIILDDLNVDKSLFKYDKPSKDYSTIKYYDYDFFRIKYTDNTKWIKIPLFTNDIINSNMDNPLFDAENNKKSLYWKSNINDLKDYKELLLEAKNFIDKQKKD